MRPNCIPDRPPCYPILYRLRWLPACLAFLLALATTQGTSVVPPDFEQLVGESDYVVRAVVKSVTAEWRVNQGHRGIFTLVELDVKEVITGTPPQPLVLVMLGGTVGDDTLTVAGAPQFKVGDEDVLFVHGNGYNFSPLVAVMHGRYPVMRDPGTGREFIARSNGRPLYNENDVAQPMAEAAAPAPVVRPDARPLSPAEFAARIRTAANSLRARTPH